MKIKNPKHICIPATNLVDVSQFMPIINHQYMQRLKFRRQLGINFMIFPGAVHTRFEHTIGVLGRTRKICMLQGLNDDDTRHLCAYALLHDIGHGPFSHQVEPVLQSDHKDNGAALLNDIKEEIEKCDLDFQRILSLFDHKDPLYQYVSDRNLGSDKLDYLLRDSLHIGFHGAPDIDTIQSHTMIVDGKICIAEKFIEDIKRIQKFYSYLHQHGYLNKSALSLQRILQRVLEEELQDGNIPADSIWQMMDHELFCLLNTVKKPIAAKLAPLLTTSNYHRTVLAVKPDGYGFVENSNNKDIAVREWSDESLKNLSEQLAKPEILREVEDTLCRKCQVPMGTILIAAMPYFAKLVPKDVYINHGNGELYKLFKKDISHHYSVKSDYLRTFAVRVIAEPGVRSYLSNNKNIKKIEEVLEKFAGNI